MASRGALFVLALLGAALAVILVVDHSRDDPATVDRRLVPEASSEVIVAIEIRLPGQPAIAIARRPGGTLALTAPLAAPLAAEAAADLIGTLEQLAYRRHVAARPTRATRAELTIRTASGRAIELAVGDDIEASGQAWIARAGRPGSFAVDRHSVRVLARGLDELRSRDVVSGDPAAASRIEIAPRTGSRIAVVMSGGMVDIGQGGTVAMDRAAAGELFAALAAIRFERFTAAPSGAAELEIRIAGSRGEQRIAVHGGCPGDPARRVVSAAAGAGCADAAPLDAITTLAARGRELWDRRFAGDVATIEQVTLAVGSARVTGDGDDSGVRSWLREVDAAAAGDAAIWIDRPRADPAGSIELTLAGGTIRRIDLHALAGGTLALARPGEAVARALPAAVSSLLESTPWRFRDRAVIARDPTEVHRIAIRDRGEVVADVTRGELLGEWTSAGGTPVNAEAAESLARALAQLEAVRFGPRGTAGHAVRTIELELDPAPGEPTGQHRALAIGGTCWAVLDQDPVAFQLDPAPCRALLGATLRQRP